MTVLLTVIAVIVAIIVVIAFLHRFYRKATRERALIRTGMGGQKVVMDGGFISLPILHRIEEINMRTMRLEVRRAGEKSLMTEDRLRLDVEMEFYLRVEPTPEGVATAAQALGAKALRPEELSNLFEGRFIDAIQAVIASNTMDALHEARSGFVRSVRESLQENLKQNGLYLESVSLTRLDQAPFAALDEKNAFNAVGMRRLVEVITENKKRRVQVEADAELSVRQTELDALKRRLELEREQQEAEIVQRETLAKLKASSDSVTEAARQQSQRAMEQARLERERDLRLVEIDRDLNLRRNEVNALLAAETAKIDSQISLARKRAEEMTAQAEVELRRHDIVDAQEKVQLHKERLAAERERSTAILRAKQDSEVSAERIRSDMDSLLERAKAEAEAEEVRASAKRQAMQSKAEGKAAIIAAENQLSEPLIRMKLDMHKIDLLPQLAERMMKPVEKIESIRINQVSGLGFGNGGNGAAGANGTGGSRSPVEQAVDGVLNMALQLPAMQKIGRSIGLNLELGDGAAEPDSDETSS